MSLVGWCTSQRTSTAYFSGTKNISRQKTTLRLPLIVLSRQLVVALPLAVLLLCHPLVNSLHQVSSSRCLVVSSSRRLVVSSSRRLVVSSSCRLVVLSSCRATSCCLVAPAGCCTIISRRPLIAIAPPPHPLIVLAGWCIASPCAALFSSLCSPSLTPSNAVERCYHHRTPPPSSPLNAVSIVHLCCHSCRPSPSPPPNTTAHLLLPRQCLSVVPTAVVVERCRCH